MTLAKKKIAKKYNKEYVAPDKYVYGLSEVYYNKNMRPNWYTEPKIWYETPEDIISDLAFMLRAARKDYKRGLSVTVTDKSIKDINPLENK